MTSFGAPVWCQGPKFQSGSDTNNPLTGLLISAHQ